jgi:hypothetical protein
MAKGSSGGVNYLKGMEHVMSNLNKQLEGVKIRSLKGLILSAALIRHETEHTSPLTPVDYGNLKASWFVTTAKRVQVGYGIHTFKGPKASQLSENHAAVLSESQSTVASQSTKDKQFLMMGYSTNYGGFVHEMIGANFKRPGAGPKWLEAHLKRNTGKIVQIVKENAEIKK